MSASIQEADAGARLQSPLWGIAASIMFVAALLAVLIHFDAHELVVHLLRWFDAQGAWFGSAIIGMASL
jgi:hypothetical protein